MAQACALPERAPIFNLTSHAVFLDLDGTLAPFQIDPAGVGPVRERSSMLHRLEQRLTGRLAIVSGRRIADVDRILESQVFAVAGAHGLERRSVCGSFKSKSHPAIPLAHAALLALAADYQGVRVEMKKLTVALHYRARPELRGELAPVVEKLSCDTELLLQEGDMVFELRPSGADKGDAVRRFMAEPPFQGSCPVYVGDDLTDESAYRAVASLGGFGILVGQPRTTAAHYSLADVDEVWDWLRALTSCAAQAASDRAINHV